MKKGRNSIHRKSNNADGGWTPKPQSQNLLAKGCPSPPLPCLLFCFLAWGESSNPPPPPLLPPLLTELTLLLGFWNPSFKYKIMHRKLKIHQKYPFFNSHLQFRIDTTSSLTRQEPDREKCDKPSDPDGKSGV